MFQVNRLLGRFQRGVLGETLTRFVHLDRVLDIGERNQAESEWFQQLNELPTLLLIVRTKYERSRRHRQIL